MKKISLGQLYYLKRFPHMSWIFIAAMIILRAPVAPSFVTKEHFLSTLSSIDDILLFQTKSKVAANHECYV